MKKNINRGPVVPVLPVCELFKTEAEVVATQLLPKLLLSLINSPHFVFFSSE